MKTAQELRSGNVFRDADGQLMIVVKGEFSKSGRNASVVKLKYKSLKTERVKEEVFKADVKFDTVELDYKPCTYSYQSNSMYVFMDEEYNQYEIGADMMGDALNYLQEEMPCELVLYENQALAIELPKIVVCEIEYTEPSVRGDTVGKVTKPARLKGTGYELQVSAICLTGDKIEIDTRTNEFKRRL
ncbi:MAG: elongation factor P [Anaerolineae bacterium]|nr:elongation factor P [Anaerolineae bacterium]